MHLEKQRSCYEFYMKGMKEHGFVDGGTMYSITEDASPRSTKRQQTSILLRDFLNPIHPSIFNDHHQIT